MQNKDDFWNLDKILPKKAPHAEVQKSVECVQVDSNSPPSQSGVDIRVLISAINEKRGINSLESAVVKERDYSHFQNSNVVNFAYVGSFNNSFTYENRIREHALSLYNKKGIPDAPFSEYFSFTPTFYELSREQLNYYLSWREEVRNSVFKKTSPSYALLLVTEIINLSDLSSPKDSLDLLLKLWKNCLSDDKRYDKIMADLIFDFCLVHDLEISYEELQPVLYSISAPVTSILFSLFVFDFLLVSKKDLQEDDLRFLFEKILCYNYRTGKHYKENAEFQALIDNNFYSILKQFFSQFPLYIEEIFEKHKKRSSPIKTVRPAFISINTSSKIKKNLVFEYYLYDKTDIELDVLLNVAKHVENKFRALSGIKARLAAGTLPVESKKELDRIFSSRFSSFTRSDEIRLPQPERHKIAVDTNAAKNIEAESWETTRKLVDGVEIFFDEEDEKDVSFNTQDTNDSDFSSLYSLLNSDETNVLCALIEKNIPKAEAFCLDIGTFLDSMIISINEKSTDTIGDVIVDPATKDIYEEYLQDIYALFSKEK